MMKLTMRENFIFCLPCVGRLRFGTAESIYSFLATYEELCLLIAMSHTASTNFAIAAMIDPMY